MTYKTSTFSVGRTEPMLALAPVRGATKSRAKKSLAAWLRQRREPSMFQKCLAVHVYAAGRYRTFG